MKPEKQKDGMSELVDILASSDTAESTIPNEGVVTTADGEKITLGIEEVARLVVKSAKERVAVRKHLMRKKVEEHLKQPPHKGG